MLPPGKTPLPLVPEPESSTVLSRQQTEESLQRGSTTAQEVATPQSADIRLRLASNDGMSLQRATVISLLVHIIGPIGLAIVTGLLLLLLSWLLHFNFWDWFRDKHPPHDLEFVLIEDTQAKRPTKPLFKGNFNQQAGGKKQPQLPVRPSESPSPAPASTTPPPQPTSQQKAKATPTTSPATPDKQPEASAKAPQADKPPGDQPMTTQKQATASPPAKTQTTPSDNQTTTLPTTSNSNQGSATGDNFNNPQGGDAAKPGVDVAEDIDFGPFMADMERRIKRNWVPPRGSERRKVKLLFYLLRDGRLSKVEVVGESKDPEAERAAIAAVEASSPFMPLPPTLKEDVLPIEFTFDYNVLNPKKSKQKSSRQDGLGVN